MPHAFDRYASGHSGRIIETDIVLRAIAISAVVFNHSHPVRPFNYAGGMTVLLMLAGYSLARFALSRTETQDLPTVILRFATRIWLPCLAIVLASFAIRRQFDLAELLFISNWFPGNDLAFLFVWYPQVVVQLLLCLALVFSIPAAARQFTARPLAATLIVFLIVFAAGRLFSQDHVPDALRTIPPQRIAWNFILGCLVFFALASPLAPRWNRVALVSLTIACAALAFGLRSLEFWTLSMSVVLLSYWPRLRLPESLARLFQIVGQASFTIFLLHVIFLRIYTLGLGLENQSGAWLFAMCGSLLAWLMATATLRVWRRLKGNDWLRRSLAPVLPGSLLAHLRPLRLGRLERH
ncbi:acyltransferase family protein [Pararhizobium haloflavum]|uniref:acyltransferase family protein n=1 Tax=Pararhizobium haloflavum TaxID=2037914 RepID=UPI000C176825|nr:acyltransferase family protein [Pararhizobium haloflavum]